MADYVTIDLATGTATTRPETAAEAADRAALAAAVQQAVADDQTRRAAVVDAVQALVGVSWAAMTVAQKQTLIVALAYKLGALDKTLTVRPLSEWL